MFEGLKVYSKAMQAVAERMACEDFEIASISVGQCHKGFADVFNFSKTTFGPILDSIAENTKHYKTDFLYDYDAMRDRVCAHNADKDPFMVYALGIRELGVDGPNYIGHKDNLYEYKDIFVITCDVDDDDYPRILTWKWKR